MKTMRRMMERSIDQRNLLVPCWTFLCDSLDWNDMLSHYRFLYHHTIHHVAQLDNLHLPIIPVLSVAQHYTQVPDLSAPIYF